MNQSSRGIERRGFCRLTFQIESVNRETQKFTWNNANLEASSELMGCEETQKANRATCIVVELLVSCLNTDQPQRILDCGCNGAQAELTPFMLDTGVEVVGLDISLDWLKEKRAKFGDRPNLKALVCGDAHCLPFGGGVFSVVTMTEVIEHLDKPDLALDEIHRCLGSNGRLILSTPNAVGIWSIVTDRMLFWLGPLGRKMRTAEYRQPTTTRHVSLFTLHGLTECLASHHFDVERVISPYGLGVTMLLEALSIRCHLPVHGGRGAAMYSRLCATLRSLERKISKILPLKVHSAWIICARKCTAGDEHPVG